MSLEETKLLAWKFVDEIFNKGHINEADKLVTPEFIYHARSRHHYYSEILLDIPNLRTNLIPYYQT